MASKYYYNDVVLPELPNTGSYSNHYIIQYSGATGYNDGFVLLATDVSAFCGSDGIEFPNTTKALAWACTDGKAWIGGSVVDVAGRYETGGGVFVWTHYDISYDAGGVYMEGSEPVLAVSKWAKMRSLVRGIMAGLVSSGYLGERTGEEPEATAAYYLYGKASTIGNVALTNGDGYALYSGEVLPKLPEWDKVTYPYAYINISTSGQRQFLAYTKPLQYGTHTVSGTTYTKPYFTVNGGEKVQYLGTPISGGTWQSLQVYTIDHTNDTGTFYVRMNEVIWANTNIPIIDTGGTYLSASVPISLASNEPVAAVHDGIKWDVRAYPYAAETYRDTTSGRYRYFFAHEYQNYFYNTTFGVNSYYYGTQNGSPKALLYMRGPSDTAWVLQERADWSIGTNPSSSDIAVWANFDLKYTDGSIHCAASEPILVYEREAM